MSFAGTDRHGKEAVPHCRALLKGAGPAVKKSRMAGLPS